MSRRQVSVVAAAAASVLSATTLTRAVPPTIDGTKDAIYGAVPFAEQTVQTGFGNNQSELDAGYSYIENGKLYIFLAGNLESNYNSMEIFFDTRAGGQNVLRTDNPNIDFNQLNTNMGGLTFDTAFAPDYYFTYNRDINTTAAYVKFSELNTNGGGLGGYLGSVATTNPGQQGSGIVGGGNLPTVEWGYNDSNTVGVGGAAPAAANPGDGAAVTTGSEFSIDLTALGATENFKIMIGINGGSHDYFSNQFLLGATAPQGNLGGDGNGNYNGTVGAINFATMLAGDQFLTINYHAPLCEWNDGDGNWSDSSKWTGDGVPNAPDARAILGSLGGVGFKTITVDGNFTVAYLKFDNSGYILSSGARGGSGLNISGNPASAAVEVVSGNHTIATPVTLLHTTNFLIAGGSSLDITGGLTAAGVTVVKTGLGNLQVPNVRSDGVSVYDGSLKIADNGTDSGASKVNFVFVNGGPSAPTARLDLADNDLIVGANTSTADVVSYIVAGRNGGDFAGNGITSSAAAGTGNTTLGVLTGAEYTSVGGSGTFSGLPYVDTDTLVKYTWYGDTDFNGGVDFDDYVRTDAGYNGALSGWLNGDFDLSGTVDFDDYVYIDLAYNTQDSTLIGAVNWLTGEDRSAANAANPGVAEVIKHFDQFGLDYANNFLAAVPEPTSAVILGLVAMPLMRRRRA